MRIPTTRCALVTAAVVAALIPSPAGATTLVCQTLVESTPSVRVDLDDDGNPEYRVPSIEDVTLCSHAGAAYTTSTPRTENCFIGWHPTCIAVYVDLTPVDVQAGADATVCFELDSSRFPVCQQVRTPPSTIPVDQTVCMGFDLGGGHPCSGSTVALELQ